MLSPCSVLCAALLSGGLTAVAAPPGTLATTGTCRESCESLQREWDNKVAPIYGSIRGDAAQERKASELAAEHRKQVWKYVNGSKRAEDLECAWRLALELDDIADSPDELQNLRRYLDEFPDGASRPWVAVRLAWKRIEAGTAEEVDREIALFDEQYPLAHLERGHLRVWASGLALDRLDVDRAQRLLQAAIALPRSAEELEQAEANKGRSWHEWWQERAERLDVYRGSFAELGGLDLDGEPFRIGDYRGKVLMLEFWASW